MALTVHSCLLLLLLSLHASLISVHAVPRFGLWPYVTVRLIPQTDMANDEDQLSSWADIQNEKRRRADGGFVSRLDAMNDYYQSELARQLVSNPYGPGKRK